MKETPNTRRRKSTAAVPATPSLVYVTPEPCTLLIEALAPSMLKAVKSVNLDGSDVRHRAILGEEISSRNM